MTTMMTASLETDLARLRSEFVEFPGLRLTVPQVARLLEVSRDEAEGLLAMLEHEGLLCHWQNGAYRRASLVLS